MKTFLRWLAVSLVALFAATASYAQQRFLSQAELDQALAPIALYPDNVLSQLLMAATYPREVAEAAAWSRANPQLMGEEAVQRVENEPWDPSVKSLVAFPQILAMMAERMDWTQRLGEAFQSSPELVSDTIQALRRRADQAGTLRSGEEMKVYRDDRYYYIEPPTPETVYVPYYDPRVAYGNWWWPSYQPVWWRPWAGYQWVAGYTGFGWGYGITLGSGFFYSGWNWPSRHIYLYNAYPRYHRGWDNRHGHRWWHDGRYRTGDRHDGRGDGRRRDGDRGGRGDGRDRDGRDRDGRDRDGRDRDGRDRDGRDRDGRDRDGRDRDGRNRERGDGRPTNRERAPAAPGAAPASQVREMPAPNPVYRDARGEQPRYAPRVNSAAPVGRGYGHPASEPQVAVPAQNPVGRKAPVAAPAAAQPQPERRAAAPAAAAGRPAPAPVVRESAPAARESAPAVRESRSDDRPGSGRGSGERSRDR